jgi:FMN phosphatase YigB (HAD superfamily)
MLSHKVSSRVALEQAGYSRYEIVTGAEEAFEIFSQWRRRVVYYPGVIETLKYLDEHYTLAALTGQETQSCVMISLSSGIDVMI